jgi:phosphoribosylanthranilate isomerase
MSRFLVKICGLTNPVDARRAAEAGADLLGFVLVPASKRAVSPQAVRDIVRGLPAGPRRVGVLADEPPERVRELLDFCGLDLAQLHGDEDEAVLRAVGLARAWKAVHLRSPEDVARALALPPVTLVVDTAAGDARGGSGVTGDWVLAARLAAQRPVLLAGGLNPENVAAAVAAVRPAGVDVSSGVEAAPGRKDAGKVRAFVAAARQAAAALWKDERTDP